MLEGMLASVRPCVSDTELQALSEPLTGRSLQFFKGREGDFPGGPVAKSLCSQCRELRFNPWSEN